VESKVPNSGVKGAK